MTTALRFIQKEQHLTEEDALTYFEEHYNNMLIDAALAEIEMTRKSIILIFTKNWAIKSRTMTKTDVGERMSIIMMVPIKQLL